jgi:hypothetical protein
VIIEIVEAKFKPFAKLEADILKIPASSFVDARLKVIALEDGS